MSGLASAISEYFEHNLDEPFGMGIDWVFLGVLRAVPGALKVYFEGFYEILSPLNWHVLTIVAPGLETSFVSFFVFGPFIFCLMFYFIAWRLNASMMNQRLSPFVRLLLVIFVSNGVFFIRGAWIHWLGFLVAFFIVMVMLYPLIKLSCRRKIEALIKIKKHRCPKQLEH